MKKVIIVFSVCFSLIVGNVAAQIPTFTKGDNVVSASIGFGGYYSGSWYSGSNYTRLPFVALYYENCVKDNLFDEKSSLGIGGMIGHTSIKWADNFKTSNTVIGLRGALHYAFVDKLDTYTGLMLGYDIVRWKYDESWGGGKGTGSSGLAFSWFLGARYYFSETIGAFAELGYGAAVFNIGLSLKF